MTSSFTCLRVFAERNVQNAAAVHEEGRVVSRPAVATGDGASLARVQRQAQRKHLFPRPPQQHQSRLLRPLHALLRTTLQLCHLQKGESIIAFRILELCMMAFLQVQLNF